MNCDELLNDQTEELLAVDMNKKEKLYSLAACGKTKQYLGTEFSIEQIQRMEPSEIERYYKRYEAQLGSKMVKSLGQTVLSLYTKLVSQFLPVDSEQDLIYDLSQDPVLTKSLEGLGCDLYYRFGGLLSPVVMGLITFNHVDFLSIKNGRDKNHRADEEGGESVGTDEAGGESDEQ